MLEFYIPSSPDFRVDHVKNMIKDMREKLATFLNRINSLHDFNPYVHICYTNKFAIEATIAESIMVA